MVSYEEVIMMVFGVVFAVIGGTYWYARRGQRDHGQILSIRFNGSPME